MDIKCGIYMLSLARRIRVRPITWPWKLWRPVLVPRKLLRTNRPRAPAIRRILHAMIYNPVFTPIRACREARVPDTVDVFRWVLRKHTAVVSLPPVLRIHRIRSNKFQLAETIVPVVGPRSTIDKEMLPSLGVRELLWAFI